MVRICVRIPRIRFESCLKCSNLNCHISTRFQMVWIYVWKHRNLFEWFEFALECFKSFSNALNPFRKVRICIGMVQIPFEWFKFGFAFECFESLSNDSNLVFEDFESPFQMVRIWFRILQISFEWSEFAFQCFKSLLNSSNLYSNPSNPFQKVLMCIRMLRIRFESFEFGL